MFNLAIIDDDVAYLQLVSDYILKTGYYNDIEIYKFSCTHKLLDEKDKIHFHLILTDTDLKDMDGIQFIHNHYPDTPVVYITSHIERMIDAFGYNVFKFVLKQNIEDFFQKEFGLIYSQLKDSLIRINSCNNINLIDIADVKYITYQDRSIMIHTIDQDYPMKRTSLISFIKTYQYDFIAVNKKTYVNWRYIRTISKTRGVVLKGSKDTFPVSAHRYYRLVEEFVKRSGGLWY